MAGKLRRDSTESVDTRLDTIEGKLNEVVRLTGGTTRASTNTLVPIFTTNVSIGGQVVNLTQSATLGHYITAIKRCKVTISYSHGGAGTPDIGLVHNPQGTDLTSFAFGGSTRYIAVSRSGYGGGGYTNVAASLILEIGDTIYPVATVNPNGTSIFVVLVEEL